MNYNILGTKLNILNEVSFEDIFPHVTRNKGTRKKYIHINNIPVRVSDDKLSLFKRNRKCVKCGLIGEKLLVQNDGISNKAHVQLYGIENDTLILMTIDHIIPRSVGGKRLSITNYQTMCIRCNQRKGNNLEAC